MDARRFGRLAASTLLAGALVAGAAACGDDDDDDVAVETPVGEGEQAAGGGDDAFCTALVDFNSAVTQIEVGPDSSAKEIAAADEALSPLWADIEENAPDDVAAEVEALDPGSPGSRMATPTPSTPRRPSPPTASSSARASGPATSRG